MIAQTRAQTRNVIVATLAIVAIGIGGTELTRGTAHADPAIVAGGAAGYAGSRVDQAFDIVTEMPAKPALSFDLAQKGDLPPLGCVGPFRPEVQAECMDVAYEVEAAMPLSVVETTSGVDNSTLMRTDRFALAGN